MHTNKQFQGNRKPKFERSTVTSPKIDDLDYDKRFFKIDLKQTYLQKVMDDKFKTFQCTLMKVYVVLLVGLLESLTPQHFNKNPYTYSSTSGIILYSEFT